MRANHRKSYKKLKPYKTNERLTLKLFAVRQVVKGLKQDKRKKENSLPTAENPYIVIRVGDVSDEDKKRFLVDVGLSCEASIVGSGLRDFYISAKAAYLTHTTSKNRSL